MIYIGADHRGFQLKEYLKGFLQNAGYAVVDAGTAYDENDDYADVARAVAEKVSANSEQSRGILVCGSGVGVDIVANKFAKVRSALVANPDQAFDSRNDDDTNVLSLGASYLRKEDAQKIVATWLQTPFSQEERHRRRLQKISLLELKMLGRDREGNGDL